MSNTETNSRPGEDVSPVTEVKTAMAGFMNDFRGFRADLQQRLQQQEEKMSMIERKSTGLKRPVLAQAAEADAPHQKAFDMYLRSGDDDALRGLELEGKALSTAVAGDGGYLVDPETSATIMSVLNSAASIRSISNVVQVESTSFDVLIDHTEVGHGWAAESGTIAESATPTLDRIVIPLHELSALPRASQRLLDDSAFDVEAWLAGRIADKFAQAEAAAFIGGDGVDKPTGFLAYPSVPDTAWSWGNLGYVATGADGAFADADAIIDLTYALGARYRANGSFVMNS
ncbi:MAG: phage major capsid protein, partial [Pseudomonadota bacterium]